ncbi:GNAT family N-acetyltransferase, partial [candidate division WOR-3 bacterium]|nr:GNAT family N-acetyltransferase [candidate division WOR-3 bacterium]
QVPDGLLGWDAYLPQGARVRIHRDWLRTYARDRSLLLAFDHGRPVGLLAEHVCDETSPVLGYSVGSIDLVATVPEYRNNGVSTRLVSSSLDLFRDRGARVAELTVHSADTLSAHYYQAQGFVTVGSALTLTNWRR